MLRFFVVTTLRRISVSRRSSRARGRGSHGRRSRPRAPSRWLAAAGPGARTAAGSGSRQWEKRCTVTCCATLETIRASHIKPWWMATNEERLDPGNGLPLVATVDTLFDAGLITFRKRWCDARLRTLLGGCIASRCTGRHPGL
jgi:hypothetical protein